MRERTRLRGGLEIAFSTSCLHTLCARVRVMCLNAQLLSHVYLSQGILGALYMLAKHKKGTMI